MRPFADIRTQIKDFEDSAGVTRTDFYREHVQFLIRKLSALKIVDFEEKANQDISVFYSHPERAVAKIHEDRNLVLPVISVALDDIDEDPDRRRTDINLVIDTVWDKAAQRAKRIVSTAPKPVRLSLMIHVWAKYVEDMNQIMESLQLMFNPAMDMVTKYSEVTQAYISGISDNSSVVVGDREDRVIRKSVQITADTYIPNKKFLYTSTGKIKEIVRADFNASSL